MTRSLALALVAACAEDVPEPPGLVELGPTLPSSTLEDLAFDPRDSLVLSNGAQLVRVSGLFIDVIAGSEAVAVHPSFGFDRDGELLVGGQTVQLVRLEPNNLLTPIGPPPPIVPFFAPVGTPAGSYAIRPRPPVGPVWLAPGGTAWVDGPDLSRSFRADDGTLYAIVDTGIVRFASDDVMLPLVDCGFAGDTCAALQLGGLDAAGQLYVGARGEEAIHAIDPAGAVTTLDLPSVLRLVDVRATTASVLVLASNPARGGEVTLWLLADGTFKRIDAIPTASGVPGRLLADHSGHTYVLDARGLEAVFLFP